MSGTLAPDASRPAAAPGTVRLPNPMILIVWLTIFVPGHLFDWWVERSFSASVFMVGCMVLMTKSSPWEARRPSNRASMLFFLIQFLYVTSYVFSVAFNGIQTGPRDYFELARYLILWAFVVYVIRHFDARVRSALETAMTASLYYSLLVLMAYRSAIPLLTPFFKGWLYAGTKTWAQGGQLRLAAPYENPNFLGFVTTLTLCCLLFYSKSRLRAVHLTAAFIVLFYSGSRTAWAASGVLLAFAVAVYLYQGLVRLKMRFAVQLSLFFLCLMLSGPWLIPRVMASSRVARVVSAMGRGGLHQEANAAERLTQAREALIFISRSPVFGWGPSKYETMSYVDNQYLLWLLRNGALGAGLIMTGLLLVSWRLLRASREDQLRLAGAAGFIASVAMMLLAGQFLDNFRLFFLTAFMAAAIAAEGR
jgi:O-antigen ligase